MTCDEPDHVSLWLCNDLGDKLRNSQAALREAIELAEDYAQYVSPFLLEKWGHTDDIAKLKSALIDGDVRP